MQYGLSWLALGFAALVAVGMGPCSGSEIVIPGLSQPVQVTTDADGVWHIVAEDDFDMAIAQGYVHCRDRLFQMDDTRRQVDGTQAEVRGLPRLPADIQARIIGLDRGPTRTASTTASRPCPCRRSTRCSSSPRCVPGRRSTRSR
jgi:penicillin amidase